MSEDYYSILGIDKTASPDEIKKAFRKKAMEYHPDRNKGDKKAEEMFKKIAEANETLSNPAKREQYDRFGSAGNFSGGNSGFNFNQGGGFGFDFSDIFQGFEDIFGGSGARSGKAASHKEQVGADLHYTLSITLEEAFSGKTEEITFKCHCKCEECEGSGSIDKKSQKCTTCNGSGSTRTQQGFFIVERPCHVCHGSGVKINNPCKKCNGSGRYQKEKTVTFDIPRGIDNANTIKLQGKGEAARLNGQPGDLYIKVQINDHERFYRKDNDLICEAPLKFTIASLGGTLKIKGIDNEEIDLTIPAGTQSNTSFTLKNKGMPSLKNKDQRGNLKVIINVQVPTKLTKEQKNILEELDKTVAANDSKLGNIFDKLKDILK